MKKLIQLSVKDYIIGLSAKEPTPGGGSSAALTAALGVSLIIMASRYSLPKAETKRISNRLEKIIDQMTCIQQRFIELIDLDAQAYADLVKAKKKPELYKKALRNANAIPKEVIKLTIKAIDAASFLAQHGNPYLLSDVEAGAYHLRAACNSAKAMIEANQ